MRFTFDTCSQLTQEKPKLTPINTSLLHLSLNRQSVRKLLSSIKENIMTVNPYKIEYQNLLKELVEDRDESLKVLEEGV